MELAERVLVSQAANMSAVANLADGGPIHEVARANGTLGKIRVLEGQLFVCHGCCCGRTEKGFPNLPIDEFKAQWKARGIRRRFHLTISGCLGPCTLANVVMLQFLGESVWLHSIESTQDVTGIYDYIERMLAEGRFLPPPAMFSRRHFQRYLVDTKDDRDCEIES